MMNVGVSYHPGEESVWNHKYLELYSGESRSYGQCMVAHRNGFYIMIMEWQTIITAVATKAVCMTNRRNCLIL